MTNLEYARKLILGTNLQRDTHICTVSSFYCWKKPLRSINKVISLWRFKILKSTKTKCKIDSYTIRDPLWAFRHQGLSVCNIWEQVFSKTILKTFNREFKRSKLEKRDPKKMVSLFSLGFWENPNMMAQPTLSI